MIQVSIDSSTHGRLSLSRTCSSVLVQICFGLLVQLHESSCLFITGINNKSSIWSDSFMLIYSILVEVIFCCIIKVHLSVLLDNSIPACVTHNHHAGSVSISCCLLLISSEITSRWPLSYRRAYSSRSNPSTTLIGLNTRRSQWRNYSVCPGSVTYISIVLNKK